MALNNGISVRLDPDTRARLEALAARYGVKSAMLIRQAILELLDRQGGNQHLTITPTVGSIGARMSGGTIGQINVGNATTSSRTRR